MNTKIRIKLQKPAPTRGQLLALEKKLPFLIPEQIKSALLELSGAEFSDNSHCEHSEVSVLKFCPLIFGEDSIEKTFDFYHSDKRIPANMFPMAIAAGGNLILCAADTGEVFFWDHELEEYSESSDGSEACTKVGENVSDFLNKLRPLQVDFSKAKVLSVKIDPDFAKKFGLKPRNN